ncbi:diguanylate cyclase [Desulfococcaceae bacterium HSG7]|nr:diguanylate cyclase [Desulfococcaceae bacterium HSG7]
MKIKKLIILIIFTWIILIVISFLWNYTNARKEQERIAFQSARSFFNHIVITRLWNARHKGMYVPVTEKTLPNPYLDVPMRDIKINDKLTLTKVNPAFMTRQISEIAMEQEGVQFNITSLKPIRPLNKPTARETQFLKEFEKGIKEKGMFIKKGVKTAYFYMAPLKTEKACLKCHAWQGYNEGDIRGAIRVTLPFIMEIPLLSLLSGHIIIGLVGLSGIVFAAKKLSYAYETIKKQAVFDALTGVPNRRNFSESVLKEYKRSQRQQQPLSIIMCDVDNFKAYNDTYGHISGDLCLKEIAQTLKTSLKRPGDFCARYGGEEFVVLLPNTPIYGAMHIAETIRSNIENLGISHESSSPKQVVTLSLGVATSEGAILASYEELVKHADIALYQAKKQGRNQVRSFSEVA